jgi:hypothetical protein
MLSEPIWCVVLPKLLSGLGCYHRLVDGLHHVMGRRSPVKLCQPTGQTCDPPATWLATVKWPVKEIMFDDSKNLGSPREQFAPSSVAGVNSVIGKPSTAWAIASAVATRSV